MSNSRNSSTSSLDRYKYSDDRITLILADNFPPTPHFISFASVNDKGDPGPLNEYVLQHLNLTIKNLPDSSELSQGNIVKVVNETVICFVVTVAGKTPSVDALDNNLLAALKSVKEFKGEFESKPLWMPLMGMGWGKLSANESYQLTINAIANFLKDNPEDKIDVTISLLPQVYATHVEPFFDLANKKFKNLSSETDAIPIHQDIAGVKDDLDRRPVAHNIARYLRKLWQSNDGFSFMLHLDGPWGSGKTTFLNLITEGLQDSKKKDNWVVVNFNAWQHQHISPPWWPLLDGVYIQAKKQLEDKEKFKTSTRKVGRNEKWRRLKMSGTLPLFFTALIFLIASAALIVTYSLAKNQPVVAEPVPVKVDGQTITVKVETPKSTSDITDYIKGIGTFLAALSGIATTIWLFSKSIVFLTSARSAQSFVSLATDPMNKVKRHFNALLKDIDHPVAIYIDDVDRCNPKYLVDLLEGIQTLFRDTRVLYVIAGDKKWISTCFEKTYGDFKESIVTPGNTLGDLFIQKAFQMSARVPYINLDQHSKFWQRLLKIKGDPEAQRSDSGVHPFDSLNTEDEILSAYESMKNSPTVKTGALREAVLRRLSERDVQETTEHELQHFWQYVGPNPRAMKRLINYYNINRDTILAEGRVVNREILIRWLIIVIDWPMLAEYLQDNPTVVDPDSADFTKAPAHIHSLFRIPSIDAILKGEYGHEPFTSNGIRNCTGKFAK
jgi:hypothetical protein